jgi:hypothetical protein
MGVGRRGDVWVFGRIRGAGEGIFSQVRVHFLFEYSTVQSLAPFGLLPHVYAFLVLAACCKSFLK